MRTSIFGTERPRGKLIRFDTPGENETQLDEDLFEQEIVDFFKTNKYLSNERVRNIARHIWGSGDVMDYFPAMGRAFQLMNQLPSEDYHKTHLGYVRKAA